MNHQSNTKYEFINLGPNVNVVERYKYRTSSPGSTIPPDKINTVFGLEQVGLSNRSNYEYIEFIPLFISAINERKIYNSLKNLKYIIFQ